MLVIERMSASVAQQVLGWMLCVANHKMFGHVSITLMPLKMLHNTFTE